MAFWTIVFVATTMLSLLLSGLIIFLFALKTIQTRSYWYALALSVSLAAVAAASTSVQIRQDVPSNAETNPDSAFRLVAMGDSYMSGEGATQYFEDSDTIHDQCHQAPDAYSRVVASRENWAYSSLACSGARTYDVLYKGQSPDSSPGDPGHIRQLASLNAINDPEIVLISIGGNDSGFSDIAKSCIRGDCLLDRVSRLQNLHDIVAPAVLKTFVAVRTAAQDSVDVRELYDRIRVFAITYPDPLGANCETVGISKEEVKWIRLTFLPRLNHVVTHAARLAGIGVIDVQHALDGHGLCDSARQAINVPTVAQASGADLLLALKNKDLTSIISDTFHPNHFGHQLLADHVDARLQIAGLGTVSGSPPSITSTPNPSDPSRVRDLRDDPGLPVAGCPGQLSGNTIVTPIQPSHGRLRISGLHPGSIVCSINSDGSPQSLYADENGFCTLRLQISGLHDQSRVEIVAELQNGVWTRIIAITDAKVDIVPANGRIYTRGGLPLRSIGEGYFIWTQIYGAAFRGILAGGVSLVLCVVFICLFRRMRPAGSAG